jgi:hypothetical protein
MAHYAKLDENDIVIDIIVIADKDCLDENGNECEEPGRCFCEALTGHAKWKKTSYNTRMGVHYDPNTGEPSQDQSKAFRLNFAQIGMKYDESLDGFVRSEKQVNARYKPFSRKVINPQTGFWALPKPETPLPNDLQLDVYPLDEYQEPWFWDEFKNEWIKLRKDEEGSINFFRYEDMI